MPDIKSDSNRNPANNAATLHPYQLGASLYMPATRSDIWQVICREKLPTLNSVIICLEDAVNENDVDFALQQLQRLLNAWAAQASEQQVSPPLVFIRPRHAQMLKQIADFDHIDLVDGFVLPKIDMQCLSHWRIACHYLADDSLLMPTLETAPIYDPLHNQ